MEPPVRTVAVFRSTKFNSSEPRDYFINECCFGDDVAKWLIDQLRTHGLSTDEKPGQEDFGWYFNFTVDGIRHTFVIGHRPGKTNEAGEWIGWLERNRGLFGAIVGARNHGIQPAATLTIHKALASSSEIHNLRWHFPKDFQAGREELGTPEP